jgi:hypothetical protein
MRLTNVSTHLVAFKLKSTAPKNYAIKPSASTIKRGEVLDVQILRRPPEETESGGGDEETTPAGKTRRPDRFLVQAAVVDTEEKKTLWQAASRGKGQGSSKFWEGVSKDELEERQLEVVLVDANGSAAFHPEPIQEGGGSSGEHGAPSKESKDGNGASGTEDKVSGKGKASKEHGEGKVAKGKKADAKAAKEAGQVADAEMLSLARSRCLARCRTKAVPGVHHQAFLLPLRHRDSCLSQQVSRNLQHLRASRLLARLLPSLHLQAKRAQRMQRCPADRRSS